MEDNTISVVEFCSFRGFSDSLHKLF